MQERVTLESGRAPADGVVGHHGADGVGAAGVDARIHTLLSDAGSVPGALAVVDTLWPAVGRLAEVVGLAAAHAGAVDHALPAVGAAVAVGARILGALCK